MLLTMPKNVEKLPPEWRDAIAAARTSHGHYVKGKKSPTYTSWSGIIYRCSGKIPKYAHITVCDRWRSFENFLADMGVRPEGTFIGRIDGSKGYEPGNCRWEVASQQNSNRPRMDYSAAAHKAWETKRGERQ